MCWAAQWGPVEYHEQSLKNLAVAMQRTKRLCAIIVDTIGREIMINRPFSLDEVCSSRGNISQGSPCARSARSAATTVPPVVSNLTVCPALLCGRSFCKGRRHNRSRCGKVLSVCGRNTTDAGRD